MAALQQAYHGIQMHEIQKRGKNWAAREPGVIVVFAIVFLVAVGVIGVYLNKMFQRRKERKVAAEAMA